MKAPLIADIVACVAAKAGVEVAALRSRDRNRSIARIRQRAYWACRELRPDLSFPWLGRYFGRDHSTVLYGVRKIIAHRASDPIERSMGDAIIAHFRPSRAPRRTLWGAVASLVLAGRRLIHARA